MDVVSAWEWVASARQYRYLPSGRFLSPAHVAGLRDLFAAEHGRAFDALARRLSRGELSVQDWELAMRRQVRSAFVAQYALGRGGLAQLEDADRMRLGALVGEQFVHLHRFAADVAAGSLSEAQVASRAQLYANSSTRAEAEGYQRAFRGLELPAHPGDGSTSCRSNCHCRWDVVDRGDEWHATWRASGDSTCADCRSRASTWSPLVIEKS
jgi:hypothetical protein